MASNLARRRDAHIAEWKRSSGARPLNVGQWRTPSDYAHTSAYCAYTARSGEYSVRGALPWVDVLSATAPRFAEIESAIDSSKSLTELPEDWDDEGAKRIAAATWESAAEALRAAVRTSFRRFNYALPAPSIGPCADGSVDLYWNTRKFTLLINVQPADSAKASDFYGEREGTKVQGQFEPASPKFDFLTLLVQP